MFAAGFNAKDTPVKQENFRRFLAMHMAVTQTVLAKQEWNKPYLYIDTNAGPGNYGDRQAPEVDGSPKIFLDLAQRELDRFEGLFIEQDDYEFAQLERNVGPLLPNRQGRRAFIYHASAESVIGLASLERWRKGLLYHDPNEPPDWELLKMVVNRFPQLDILVNLNCGAIKRMAGAGLEVTRLLDGLTGVGKAHVLHTHRAQGQWQWLMVLLSNFQFKEWRSAGIVEYNPDLLSYLDRSERERKASQPVLFS